MACNFHVIGCITNAIPMLYILSSAIKHHTIIIIQLCYIYFIKHLFWQSDKQYWTVVRFDSKHFSQLHIKA